MYNIFMGSILSPYSQYFKKEINFRRKFIAAENIFEKIIDSTKSVTVTMNRGIVEVSNINMSKADLVALGNFLLEKYK